MQLTKDEFICAVDRNNQRLFLIALSFVKSRSDAEDILQDVFLKLWKHDKEFQDREHMDKWLTRVTVNHSKNYIKAPFRRLSEPLEAAEGKLTSDTDGSAELISAVMSLPKKQSAVIHLFYYEDMSVKEIADMLSINESAVKTRLCRARAKLKEILGDDWYDE